MCDAVVVRSSAIALGLKDPRYLGIAGFMAIAFISYGVHSLVIHEFAYTRFGRYDGALC